MDVSNTGTGSSEASDQTTTASTTQPMVRVSHLTKRFGDQVVVDDVSLDVAEGEVVSIIGPSGAGKSTFLRCVNLLEIPDSGSIVVAGHSFEGGGGRSQRQNASLRREVGMVFQSFNLFPHLTVIRNVSLGQQRVLGRSREAADAISTELLDRVGLGMKANAYPGQCSGGQQQRIAIARALSLEPRVMLFDEPTSSLDPELGLEVLAVMRELASGGLTMLVVTHEIHFAEDVSDHVLVMADGREIEYGPPSEVLQNPQIERTRRFLRAILER